MTNQIIKRLISEKQEKDYFMESYEIDTNFGVIKELHFTRNENNNLFGSLTLKTIIRQWNSQEGKFRQNKRFVIIKNGKEFASIFANVRWDAQNNREYYENKQEIDLFFAIWKQQIQISELQSLVSNLVTQEK